MKFLLKLKHWQLLGLMWGVPALFVVLLFIMPQSDVTRQFILLSIVWFAFFMFGWHWAIATTFHAKLTRPTQLILKTFKGMFALLTISIGVAFAFVYMIAMKEQLVENHPFVATLEKLLPLVALISLFAILWYILFAGRVLTSFELGKDATWKESLHYSKLLINSVQGVWALQSKLNQWIQK